LSGRGLLGWAVLLAWAWTAAELWLAFGRLPAAGFVLAGAMGASWLLLRAGRPADTRRPAA